MDRLRLVLFILCLMLAQILCAQQGYHIYRFKVPPIERTYDEKNLYAALNDLDQDGTYVIDPTTGTVRMNMYTTVDGPSLTKYLAYYGFTVSGLEEWNAATDAMEPVPDIDTDAYPKYRDTGNPVLDNAAYDKAKERWIATHRDLYEQRTAPRTTTE